MNFSTAMPLLNTYGDILNISSSELEREMFKYNATKEMGFYLLMNPKIMKLIIFIDTIAVSSSECERSFSTMNRVKTPGRSKMFDIRTSDLVLLAHEKSLAKGLDIKKLIKAFAKKRAEESPFSEQFFVCSESY